MIGIQDFKAQWEEIRDNVLEVVCSVGESGNYILGEQVTLFEKALSQCWPAKHAIGCGNGLDAIEISLRCMKATKNDKVISTPLSAFATTLAIMKVGCTVIFIDVDNNGLMDLDQAEKALQISGANFMIPVHLYGFPLNMKRLTQMVTQYQINLVEDCAQAIGARYANCPVGSASQMAITSFYPTKNLGCLGDGGAILTHSDSLAKLASAVRDYGQTAKYEHSHFGLNSRLDEIQAAILTHALLPHLDGFTAKRKSVAHRFLNEIKNPLIRVPSVDPSSSPVWHIFPVFIKAEKRNHFRQHLLDRGIGSTIHYPKLISDQEALKKYSAFELMGNLGNARRIVSEEVSLPIHPYLLDAEIEQIINACNSWRPN